MNVNKFLTSDISMGKACGSSLTDYRPHAGGRPGGLLRPGARKFQDVDEGANLWSPCSDCSSSDENNSPSALNSFDWDKPALGNKTVDFGWSSDKSVAPSKISRLQLNNDGKRPLSSSYVNLQSEDKISKQLDLSGADLPTSSKLSQSSQRLESTTVPIQSEEEESSPCLEYQKTTDPNDSSSESDTASYPNQRNESTVSRLQEEQEDLRNAPWFQAGIPREIALEVLANKSEGSFIVRESTTKPGCYALSLKVPPGRNETGIAHYLILHTNKGYKIKGFTKEFRTLNSLITHHSVMQELLPCPLSLDRSFNRDAEKEFAETEQKTCDLFTDIHWLMNDFEA